MDPDDVRELRSALDSIETVIADARRLAKRERMCGIATGLIDRTDRAASVIENIVWKLEWKPVDVTPMCTSHA